MDTAFTLKHENPKRNSNIVSKLFYGWAIKLFYTGKKRTLQLEDLYKTLEQDKSDYLGDKLEKKWIQEILKRKENRNYSPNLLKVILSTFGFEYMICGIMMLIGRSILGPLQAMILSWFIKQFEEETVHDRTLKYVWAGTMVTISTLSVLIFHHNMYRLQCVGMRIRIALSSLVYRKILKLDKCAQNKTATGQIVNLLSNDVQRFDQVCVYLHWLWIMPLVVGVISYLLWNAVGISCLTGILAMALCTLPLQAYFGKLTSSLRRKVAQRQDKRIKLMSEIISGIQVIKMYAWEKPFEKLVKYLRMREINVLTKSSYLRGFYLSCMVFTERTTLFLTILCYILLGHQLRAHIVFSMAQLFNLLQSAMAIGYPMAISLGAEALVTIKRVEEFLLLEEIEEAIVKNIAAPEVKIRGVSSAWTPDRITLNNIDLHVPKGCLCAIVGPVGAGKSSILQLLLGELPPFNGCIQIGQNISYSSQEPWLFAASVRKNILFGKPYDPKFYKEVVHFCALEGDFEQFPFGDKTIVGERGAILSGGQRARINLARAIYRQADIYLLDDPLSAVDTQVGKHLFEKCIVDYLQGKTRILITHQLQFLKKADLIVVLTEGRIEAKGTFQELSNSDLDFTKILTLANGTDNETVKKKDENEEKEQDSKENLYVNKRRSSVMSTTSDMAEKIQDYEEETSEFLDGSPFWEYIKSVGNFCLVVTLILILILSQMSCTCTDLWVTILTGQEELRLLNNTKTLQNEHEMEHIEVYLLPNFTNLNKPFTNYTPNYYTYSEKAWQQKEHFLNLPLDNIFDKVQINNVTHTLFKVNVALYIYSSLIILTIALTIVRTLVFFKTAMKASDKIHKKIFYHLLQAPMRFFDINPSGRVLNRFTKDIGAIDEVLPRVLMDAIQIILVLSGILVNVIISNYFMIIAAVILGTVFVQIQRWYIASAKRIKQMEGIAKSPLFSYVNSTLTGLTTIRAARAEKILIKEFDEHQNVHTSAWVLTVLCSCAFGLWLDIVCIIFITSVIFGFVIAADFGIAQNSSFVGLAISQSLILTVMLQYGMKQTSEVINQLTSVERVLQYTKLENEGPFETPKGLLPILTWPSLAKIEFKNLNLTYVIEQAPILKNLNFLIRSKEKVGIVGRTGAGKSSLITALFRLAPIKGQILIDDLNIKTIGLTDLRKNISIIPQEPVLFSATLRYNLDPFNEFEDNKLWTALKEVELKDLVTTLDFEVSKDGSNFSLGQRQLLCLARALLRNNKILILDEATANVDARTDNLIQTTIRKKFKSCTVLIIAHRLNTIMDSDKVLVMGSGQILEFDHPHKLLKNPDGHFTKLVTETGTIMTEQLKSAAYIAWKRYENGTDNEDQDEPETSRL